VSVNADLALPNGDLAQNVIHCTIGQVGPAVRRDIDCQLAQFIGNGHGRGAGA
jgi:hypothetical protein